MNIAEPILKLFRKASVPTVEVGDVVRVHQKIKEGGKERIQVFEGIVIATHEKDSLDATFTVRKIASGVGVEKTYLLHSPRITKIEFKRSSNVRRAKLYYLRNLTGKALKMKDRKVTKDNWDEMLVSADAQLEPTEADVAEAVEAAAEAEALNEGVGGATTSQTEVMTDEPVETPVGEEVAETSEVVEDSEVSSENDQPEISNPEETQAPESTDSGSQVEDKSA